MSLHIAHSKTDQLRKGDGVVIARSGNATCPVAMLELYMARTDMQAQERELLFRPICSSKRGESLRVSGGHKLYLPQGEVQEKA